MREKKNIKGANGDRITIVILLNKKELGKRNLFHHKTYKSFSSTYGGNHHVR